ncbi:MAG: hypothetical protein HY673_00510 [Chloroflexi bacterium]|nr:hypothetical protein [Chloroflexota bacterium]
MGLAFVLSLFNFNGEVVAVELGQPAEHIQRQPPPWCGEVHLLGDRNEGNARLAQNIQRFKSNPQVPGEAVKFMDHQDIIDVGLCIGQGLTEGRALAYFVGAGRFPFVNVFVHRFPPAALAQQLEGSLLGVY